MGSAPSRCCDSFRNPVARTLPCLQGDFHGPGCVRHRTLSLHARLVLKRVHSAATHRAFSSIAFANRKENVQRQGGNHYGAPPFLLLLFPSVRTSRQDGNALRSLLAAKANSSGFIWRDAQVTRFINAPLLPVAVRFGPQSYLRCTSKSGGLQLSPVQCCPLPACFPPRSFLLAFRAQTRLLVNMPC